MLDVHDFLIRKIALDHADRTLVLSLVDEAGDLYELSIENVRQVAGDGLRLQNVVLDLSQYAQVSDEHEYQRACEMLRLNRADDLLQNGCSIIFIQASVGIEIACLTGSRQPPTLTHLED